MHSAPGEMKNRSTTEKLQTEDLILGYDETAVIRRLEVEVPEGKVTSVVEPNGCGKSTLLRSLARLMRPRSGAVYLDGIAISKLPTGEVARKLNILPQNPNSPEGLTVRELTALGRYPHQRWFRQWSKDDEQAIERALKMTGVLKLADRPLDTLSGGQRQAPGSRWPSPKRPRPYSLTSQRPFWIWRTSLRYCSSSIGSTARRDVPSSCSCTT